MSVRLKRLQSDYDSIRKLIQHFPQVSVESVAGNPPEKYKLLLNVSSIRERSGILEKANKHRLEIRFPSGYPRDAPLCRMLTPIFHPNIAPHAVCIGDHWSAGESLDELVLRVCEIVAYQSYNTKSPLNGEAARWVENNLSKLPLDNADFISDRYEYLDNRISLGDKCDNCAEASATSMIRCAKGHAICENCTYHCPTCSRLLCLACETLICANCEAMLRTDPSV